MKFMLGAMAKNVAGSILNMGNNEMAMRMALSNAPPIPMVQAQGKKLDQALDPNNLVDPVPIPPGIEGEMADDLMNGGTAAGAIGTASLFQGLA